MGSSTSSSSRLPIYPGGCRLSVVIVNYRGWDDVVTLVDSLTPSVLVESGQCEILVVDNDSGQPIPESFQTPRAGVRLVLEPSNDGFSSGVNAGWRVARSPWLLVLNPDIVAEANLLDRVLDRIDAFETRLEGIPGVVGFALRNPDGTRQPSVGAFPTLARTVWEQVIPRDRRKYQPDWRVRPGRVDWVTGACFLVAAPMLAALGGMDEDFFLYYEEVALCRVASRSGWSVEFDPSIAVVHLRPLQNRAISTRMRVITRHSKLLYFRKHLPGWQFVALAGVIQAEAKLRANWCRIRGKPGIRAWRAIGGMARRLRSGVNFGGRAVRDLADSTEESASLADDEGDPRPAWSRRNRRRARTGRGRQAVAVARSAASWDSIKRMDPS